VQGRSTQSDVSRVAVNEGSAQRLEGVHTAEKEKKTS
jgi:hypothetical protein